MVLIVTENCPPWITAPLNNATDCWSVMLQLVQPGSKIQRKKVFVCCIGQANSFSTGYVGQHVCHSLLLFCRKITLVLDAIKICVSGELCHVGWWNYLVVESLQRCFSEHCKLTFLVLFFLILVPPSQPYLSSASQVSLRWHCYLNHDLAECFWPSYGLLPNKTNFLLPLCSQVFSL